MSEALTRIIESVKEKRLILLDLDNTLYAYAPCHRAGLAAATAAYLRDFDGSKSEEAFIAAYDQGRRAVHQRLSGTASSHSRLLYFQAALEEINPELSETLALDLESAYWNGYLESMALAPWCMGFFEFCRREGKRVTIVTNLTTQIQMQKLRKLGIEGHIDCLVSSEEIGIEKPDPRIFEYALQKVGGGSDEAIIVGDDQRSDSSSSIAYIHCDSNGLLSV